MEQGHSAVSEHQELPLPHTLQAVLQGCNCSQCLLNLPGRSSSAGAGRAPAAELQRAAVCSCCVVEADRGGGQRQLVMLDGMPSGLHAHG